MSGSATLRDLDPRWQDPELPARGGRDRFHVAINMEGNGRWALLRGQPRELGHVAGASALRRTVECAPALGITTLTLYAFSSDNWRRPQGEVDHLMRLFPVHLVSECDHLAERGVRFNVIGRRDPDRAFSKPPRQAASRMTSCGNRPVRRASLRSPDMRASFG
jgi:undecaprenyl diphosphate synthase